MPTGALLRLTLAYRAPLAWDVLLHLLARDAVEGVEVLRGRRYGRTVRIGGRTGIVLADDASGDPTRRHGRGAAPRPAQTHVRIAVSPSLVPVLMPLLSRLRHLFDLDAEPAVVDAHLAAAGLAAEVCLRPGVRIPGAIDEFDVALRAVLRGPPWPAARLHAARDLARCVTWALGEPIDTGVPELSRLAPSADRVAELRADGLVALGVPRRRAEATVALARSIADGELRLGPGRDPAATRAALADVTGLDDRTVDTIVLRTLGWPDVFPASDRALQRAANASDAHALQSLAEQWRPWRSYAAVHLWLRNVAAPVDRAGAAQDAPADQDRRAG